MTAYLSAYLRDWAAQEFLSFRLRRRFSASHQPARSSLGWGVASVAPQPFFRFRRHAESGAALGTGDVR